MFDDDDPANGQDERRSLTSLESTADKHNARLKPGSDDVGVPFRCTGRLFRDGVLYLLMAGPTGRLLVQQPDSLDVVPDGVSLTFTPEFILVVTSA